LGTNDEFKAVNIKLNKVETLKPCWVFLRNEFFSIMLSPPSPPKKKKKTLEHNQYYKDAGLNNYHYY
jgi:hypothetical protein